jgi:hypothetical protein
MLVEEAVGAIDTAEHLGLQLANQLRAKGADAILAALD